MVRGGAAGTTTKLAVYPVNGGAGSLVTVTVAANGIATQTSSIALASAYVAPVAKVKADKPDQPFQAKQILFDRDTSQNRHAYCPKSQKSFS